MNEEDTEISIVRLLFSGMVLIVIGIPGYYIGTSMDTQPEIEYKYEIKTEQVQTDKGYEGGNITYINNLPEDYQNAIWEAHKKTNTFLTKSSVTIYRDEKLNESLSSWNKVEVEGVVLFIGVIGPEKVESYSSSSRKSFSRVLTNVGGFATLSGLLFIIVAVIKIARKK